MQPTLNKNNKINCFKLPLKLIKNLQNPFLTNFRLESHKSGVHNVFYAGRIRVNECGWLARGAVLMVDGLGRGAWRHHPTAGQRREDKRCFPWVFCNVEIQSTFLVLTEMPFSSILIF